METIILVVAAVWNVVLHPLCGDVLSFSYYCFLVEY